MPPKTPVTPTAGRSNVPFVPVIETPRITRAAALRSRGSASAKLPMGINCVCGHNFLNASDSLIYCEKCSLWSHRRCVGLNGKSAIEIMNMKFVCPFCSGEWYKRTRSGEQMTARGNSSKEASSQKNGSSGGIVGNSSTDTISNNNGASSSTKSTVTKVKLDEVPDKPPQASVAALIRSTLSLLLTSLDSELDVTLEFVPPLSSTTFLPQYPNMDDNPLNWNYTTTVVADGGADANVQCAMQASSSSSSTPTTNSSNGGRRLALASRSATPAALAASASPSPTSASISSAGAAAIPNTNANANNTNTTTNSNTVFVAFDPENMAPHEHPAFPKRLAKVLPDTMIAECLSCCASAIENATFSESYPTYCLKELQAFPQKYLQGTFARCKKTGKIVAFVLSNGMDAYGNLKGSISQLRQIHSKTQKAMGGGGGDANNSNNNNNYMNDYNNANATLLHLGAAMNGLTPEAAADLVATNPLLASYLIPPTPSWVQDCLEISDINDFVHITLIATHEANRGRGLAKRLLLVDSLRWLLRGRTRAYLNMALERQKVPISSSRPASAPATPPPAGAAVTSSSTTTAAANANKNNSKTSKVEASVAAAAETKKKMTSASSRKAKNGINNNTNAAAEHDDDGVDAGDAAAVTTANGDEGEGENVGEDDHDVICVASAASRRLYMTLGFADVIPSRVDVETNAIKWTVKEEEGGKVMANLDMKESARNVSRQLLGDSAPLFSGRKVLKLGKK